MVENATKAPSGHNTQPWKFKLVGDTIEIHPDFSKELPIIDPNHRELYVSLGCAAENLSIAATTMGYKTDLNITDDGILELKLEKTDIDSDPLASQISLRQSNRSAGNGEIIPTNQIEELKKTKLYPGVKIHLYQNGGKETRIIADYVRQGNDQQMNNPSFKGELFDWMRLNKKQQEQAGAQSEENIPEDNAQDNSAPADDQGQGVSQDNTSEQAVPTDGANPAQ